MFDEATALVDSVLVETEFSHRIHVGLQGTELVTDAEAGSSEPGYMDNRIAA